jgi:hypothetical protein
VRLQLTTAACETGTPTGAGAHAVTAAAECKVSVYVAVGHWACWQAEGHCRMQRAAASTPVQSRFQRSSIIQVCLRQVLLPCTHAVCYVQQLI